MKKEIELPEIVEFLKVTRIINRQLNLFKVNKLDEDHKKVVIDAIKKTNKRINNYLGEGEGA